MPGSLRTVCVLGNALRGCGHDQPIKGPNRKIYVRRWLSSVALNEQQSAERAYQFLEEICRARYVAIWVGERARDRSGLAGDLADRVRGEVLAICDEYEPVLRGLPEGAYLEALRAEYRGQGYQGALPIEELLARPVTYLGFSSRTLALLKGKRIETIGDLVARPKSEFSVPTRSERRERARNAAIGPKTAREIAEKVYGYGLDFGMSRPEQGNTAGCYQS